MTAREVPVSILHRRDLARDGSAPLLLYGYGSYGMAMPASFSANRLSLVDRGFVYAIAHIRGGADKGWGWYLDGKREKKTNSFDDFAACARALIEAKYTSAKRIVGHGGSAGGMLMGAVANRAGELFAGIVAEVPFVDVLNTMLDDTLPLTPPEWPEWGNPIESDDGFQDHSVLLALRQCRGEGLSGDPGDGRPDRSARHLLGAGEMDRAAARHHDRRRPGAVAHQYGRRPWRRLGPLQPARRSRDRLCVRAVGGGDGGSNLVARIERSEIRGQSPDCAALHPGYKCCTPLPPHLLPPRRKIGQRLLVGRRIKPENAAAAGRPPR